jgi:hypothetical protein
MKLASLSLLFSSLMVSCATKDLDNVPPGTLGIIVAHEVECTSQRDGQFTLPAGHYRAEAQSSKGIYYAAPEPLKTSGVIRAGRERGGLFIAKEGWQWLWTGHPYFEVEENKTSILGKRGIMMPNHYKFEPYVNYTRAKN